jgi:hypothetical protein
MSTTLVRMAATGAGAYDLNYDRMADIKAVYDPDNVVAGPPSVTQQRLQLGFLDAIHIDLAPVVLGRGIPALRSPDQAGRAPCHRGFQEPAHHAHHLPSHQVPASPRAHP